MKHLKTPKQFNELSEKMNITDGMPNIGYRYYIIENGKKIWGVVDSYEGTGFYVTWDDDRITHEEKVDNTR